MSAELSRTIQNTSRIQEAISNCVQLVRESSNRNLSQHAFTIEKLEKELDEKFLELEFLENLKSFWNESLLSNEKKIYVHELIAGSDLYLPKYEPLPRNPELEARVSQIRAQIEEQEYQRMVSNVDLNSPMRFKEFRASDGATIPEFKTVQGQLIAIINVFAVIGGSFVFGYKAVEYSLREPDITKQMMGGLVLALIVAVADFYFLFKKLMRIDNQEARGSDANTVLKSSTNKKANRAKVPYTNKKED